MHSIQQMKVLRFDIGTLKAPQETPQGFLLVQGYASRAGVFEYMNADGSVRRELRLPEDVFAPKSLASYRGAPMTSDHPTVKVDSANVARLAVGTVLEDAKKDGDHIAVDMVVQEANAIRDLRERRRAALSSGYSVRMDETPGIHPVYGPYDAIQRDIEINHLALVEAGRAGPAARVRMDSLHLDATTRATAAFMVETNAPEKTANREENSRMGNENQQHNDSPEALKTMLLKAAEQLTAAEKRATIAETEAATQRSRADLAEGQLLSSQKALEVAISQRSDSQILDLKDAQIVELKKEVVELTSKLDTATDPAVREKKAKERARLLSIGGMHLRDEKNLRVDSMSDKEIQVLVVKKLQGLDVAAKSNDYILGCFEQAIAGHADTQDKLAELRALVPDAKRNDAAPLQSEREKYLENQQNGWRKPVTTSNQKGA